MALPTKTDIQTLDWSKNGLPWCKVPARSDIDTRTLDWSLDGEPWVGNPYGNGGAVLDIVAAGGISSGETLGLPTLTPGPVFIAGVGNITGAETFGLLTVTPGPVGITGAGNIPGDEAFGLPIVRHIQFMAPPGKLALAVSIRSLQATPAIGHLMVVPQITRLQVTPDA